MADITSHGFDTNWERVEWIKRLCKGSGIRRQIDGFPYALFGVTDHWGLILLIEEAVREMPPWMSSAAIQRALDTADEETQYMGLRGREYYYSTNAANLTKRRAFTADEFNVSVRTVMRLEDAGAQLLEFFVSRLIGRSSLDWVHAAWQSFIDVERYVERAGFAVPEDLSKTFAEILEQFSDQRFRESFNDG